MSKGELPGQPGSDWETDAENIWIDPHTSGYEVTLLSGQNTIDFETLDEAALASLYIYANGERELYCRVSKGLSPALSATLRSFSRFPDSTFDTSEWNALEQDGPIALLYLAKHTCGDDSTPALFIAHPTAVNPGIAFEYILQQIIDKERTALAIKGSRN